MCLVNDKPVLKLYTNKLNNNKKNDNYNFLDDLRKYHNIDNIYFMLDKLDDQVLKNIYNYIFLKWVKINESNEYKYVRKMNHSKFNSDLNKFINKKLYKSIYVFNSIFVYLIH